MKLNDRKMIILKDRYLCIFYYAVAYHKSVRKLEVNVTNNMDIFLVNLYSN